jgi:hypothetical protein
MHRDREDAQNRSHRKKVMRRLVLYMLFWFACFIAGWGCGKEPPVVKREPMRKSRIPSRVVPVRNP